MAEGKSGFLKWFLFILTAIVVFVAGLFFSTIVENRAEKVTRLQPVTDIPEWEPRNEVWGENFPREFETYLKTRDTSFRSPHGGSAKIDYLDEYPELVVLWAGYGFSKDYNQGRGHAYAIEDIRQTLRTGGLESSPMKATCWTCKSTDVPRVMDIAGVADFYKGKWIEKGDQIINPIGCQDCHDNETMDLKISRPALIEALENTGKQLKDVTHNEMRSLVCAQCHVEYYFKKEPENYLKFPWDNGFSAEDMEEYYDNLEFSDWTHKLSRTPMLKAQHPDYEIFMTSVHAERGVSCADCHMPYKVEGGIKFTDHHIQSPMNNISNSCQTCHRESEEQLKSDVVERQEKVLQLRRIAEKAIASAHMEAKIAWDNGASEEQMKKALTHIRHAQWRWDWCAAGNSVGFHAPIEILNVLGTSIQKAELARKELALVLTRLGMDYPVELPDISTKEKAQKYIGLNMEELKDDKEELLKKVVTKWDKEAKERQGTLYDY